MISTMEQWDELLNSLSVETMHDIYKSSAYGTASHIFHKQTDSVCL